MGEGDRKWREGARGREARGRNLGPYPFFPSPLSLGFACHIRAQRRLLLTRHLNESSVTIRAPARDDHEPTICDETRLPRPPRPTKILLLEKQRLRRLPHSQLLLHRHPL